MGARHRKRARGKYALPVAGTALAAALTYTAADEEEPAEVTTAEIPVIRPFDEKYMAEVSEVRRDVALAVRALPATPAPLPPPPVLKPPAKVSVPDPEPEPEPEPANTSTDGLSSLRSEVIAFARAQIGEPYLWGGSGPDTWDCSGLTQAAFASVGLSIPRVSSDQHNIGATVSISSLSPGDLVGWDGHVALYSGGGNIIEAPRPGEYVRERPLADHWFDQGAWGIRLDYSTL